MRHRIDTHLSNDAWATFMAIAESREDKSMHGAIEHAADVVSRCWDLLEETEKDKRLSYAPANVQVNAPLALIQVALSERANTLRKVLGMPPAHYVKGKGWTEVAA